MNDASIKNKELIARLIEIREVCSVASSMDDTNLNLLLMEIDRLAAACIETLDKEFSE